MSEYDVRGGLTSAVDQVGARTEYSYDNYDRLISTKVTKDGKINTESYTYDCEGNRLTKTTNGKLTKYIVDSNSLSQILAELDRTHTWC